MTTPPSSAPRRRPAKPKTQKGASGTASEHQHGHPHSHPHSHHDHTEQARELLRKRGLRITGPRVAVLRCLLDTHRPTSAQEIIDVVSKEGMDQVTVYRTLNTLVVEAIAQAVGTTDRGRRFEVHACEGCRVDHPHLECRGCGDIQCMEHGLLPAMIIPTDIGGFLVEEAKLYLYGWCTRCQSAGRTTSKTPESADTAAPDSRDTKDTKTRRTKRSAVPS